MWLAWVAWTLVGVRADATAADAELRSLRKDLDVRSMLEGDGVEALRLSGERFDGIAERLDNPLLAPLRVAPVIGRQLVAATHQARAASEGLHTAAEVTRQLRGLVDTSMKSGPARVAALHEVERVVEAGRPVFQDLDLGPDNALLGPLVTARGRIEDARTEALSTLDRTAAVSAGLAEFFQGPSDYLLLAANNAQMQNGQGMFLSAGVLHVQDGRMDLQSMESTKDVPHASPPVKLDSDLAARWGWLDPNNDFRHLGLSHRFPVTARTAADLWAAAGRPAVDGVLVVDPLLLKVIMEASGPVATAAGEITAAEIVRFALHDQYQGYLTAQGGDGSYTDRRRDQLGEIAVGALHNFEAVDSVDSAFLEDFAAVARGRHLLGWAADASVQAGWEAAGIDGQIAPTSAMVSVINRSGNKLDWFLRTSASIDVKPDDHGYQGIIRITVDNRAPATGEPAYVVGPYPRSGLNKGEYLGLVTVNLPEAATDSRFDGIDQLAVAGGDGHNRTVAAWVHIQRGEKSELVVRFRLPKGTASLRIEPSGRWNSTAWSAGTARWHDSEAHTLDLPIGR